MNAVITIDQKAKYWSERLHKHDHKQYEVENITIIKERLKNILGDKFWQLKPEFQSFVLINDKRALIDLYFPQLNKGIEIDEGHHKHQVEADKKREKEITQAKYQDAVKSGLTYEAFHIRVTEGYDINEADINAAVNGIVKAINEYEKDHVLIWKDEPGIIRYNHGDAIHTGDKFANMSDAYNTIMQAVIYGKKNNRSHDSLETIYAQFCLKPSKCCFQRWPNKQIKKLYPNNQVEIWTTPIHGKIKGSKLKNDIYYFNEYSEDLNINNMYTNDTHIITNTDIVRIVFSKDEDGDVVFMGVYKFLGVFNTNKTINNVNCINVHKFVKLSDEFKIK